MQNRVRLMLHDIKSMVGHNKVFVRGSYRTGVSYISDLDIGIVTPGAIKSNKAEYRKYIYNALSQLMNTDRATGQKTAGAPIFFDNIRFMDINGELGNEVTMRETDILLGHKERKSIDELIDISHNIAMFFFYPIDPKSYQYVRIEALFSNTKFNLFDKTCEESRKRRDQDIIKAFKRLTSCIMYFTKNTSTVLQSKTLTSECKTQLDKQVSCNRDIISKYDLLRSILEAIDLVAYFHKYGTSNNQTRTPTTLYNKTLDYPILIINSMIVRISKSILHFSKQQPKDVKSKTHPYIYNPINGDKPLTYETAGKIISAYQTWVKNTVSNINKRYLAQYNKAYNVYRKCIDTPLRLSIMRSSTARLPISVSKSRKNTRKQNQKHTSRRINKTKKQKTTK